MKKNWKMILGIILALVVVIFSMMNMEKATVNFGFTTVKQPLVILILVSVLIGAILVALFSSGSMLSKKHEIRKLNKALDSEKGDREQAIQERIQTLQENYEQMLKEKDDQIQSLEAKVSQLENPSSDQSQVES